MSGQRLGLVLVLLVYMVGPNPKISGAQIGDVFLAIFAITYLATTRPRLHGGLLILFVTPALIVLFTILGKTMTGAVFGPEEVNHFLKVTSLGVLGFLGVSFGLRDGVEEELRTAHRLVQIAVIAIGVTGVLGLVEYTQPGLFREMAGGLYEMQLRTGVSSVELAQTHGRVTSIFSWTNAFAEFLVFTLTVLLVNGRSLRPMTVVPTVGIGIACLFLTSSRTSMMLFVFMLCYLAMVRRRWGVLMGAGLVVAAVLALVPLESLIGPQNTDRLVELRDFVRRGELPWNVQTRLRTLSYLPGRVLESPYAYFGFPIATYQSTIFLSWDNQYLGFLVKYGLAGGAMMLWQWFTVVVPVLVLRRRHPWDERMRNYLHKLIVLNLMVAIGGLAADTLFLERWQEFFFAFQGVVLGSAVTWPATFERSRSVDHAAAEATS